MKAPQDNYEEVKILFTKQTGLDYESHKSEFLSYYAATSSDALYQIMTDKGYVLEKQIAELNIRIDNLMEQLDELRSKF